MLNILPSQQKVLVKREYIRRRVVVALSFLVFALIVSLALLSPSYFLTQVKAKIVRNELEVTKQKLYAELPSDETMKSLSVAVKHAEALRPLTKPVSVYELLRIFESKPESIKITNIAYAKLDADMSSVTLRGMAENRESLTSFGRTLENRVEFVSVDLPVSNFVKERDIDFSMTIILK